MSDIHQSELHERLLKSTLEEVFGDIDAELLARIRTKMRTVALPGGQVLFHQGDLSDSIYLVLSGRLRASITDSEGHTAPLGDIGRGEPIGEMGVISQEPRGATITALRDCVLLRLSASDFTDLLQTWPNIALPLAKKLIERLSKSNSKHAGQRHLVNVCVVPLHADIDMAALSLALRDTLAHQLAQAPGEATAVQSSVNLIDRSAMNQALGPGFADTEVTQMEPYHQQLAWLDQQEINHTMQVLVADQEDTPWTRLCLRHADLVLLVAHAQGDLQLTEVERLHLCPETSAAAVTRSLLLLHPRTVKSPTNTRRWLQSRPYLVMEGFSHFHARQEHASDWARLGRILSGQATGLVLAGGGARGFSQLGVMQALQEQGIEWDMAGGTSIGSVMAAYAAMDLDAQRITHLASQAFAVNPTGDFNWFPIMSVIRGNRLASVAHNAIVDALGADIDIEDLWKPYFCVASNYSRAQVQIMRQGNLAKSITASVSIPAALPPVLSEGDLLTDGGTFNNFPVDIMRASGAARLIGVDMSNENYRPLRLQAMPSSFELFVDRVLRPRSRRKYKGLPNLAAVVFNVAAMSSNSHQKRMRKEVDLGFTPDVSRVGMLDWGAFDRVVQIGLEHARDKLGSKGRGTLP